MLFGTGGRGVHGDGPHSWPPPGGGTRAPRRPAGTLEAEVLAVLRAAGDR